MYQIGVMVIYRFHSNVGTLVSGGDLILSIERKRRKIRSYFPSVSFDLIEIGHNISKRGILLSPDDTVHLTQVSSAPAASCSPVVGCSGGTSFACF